MIKGSNRRMFRKSQRKPGAAKRALGILASSQELMNTVEPKRNPVTGLQEFFMPAGAAVATGAAPAVTAGTAATGALATGAAINNRMNTISPSSFDSRLTELKQELDELMQRRSFYGRSGGPSNALDIRINQKMREIEAVGRQAQEAAASAAQQAGPNTLLDTGTRVSGRAMNQAISDVASKFGTRELTQDAISILQQVPEIQAGDSTATVAKKIAARIGVPMLQAVELAEQLPYEAGRLTQKALSADLGSSISAAKDVIRGAGAAVQESGVVPATQAAVQSVMDDPRGTIDRSALGTPVKIAEIGIQKAIDDPVGFIKQAGALIGQQIAGVPGGAERRAALKGTTLEEKQKELAEIASKEMAKTGAAGAEARDAALKEEAANMQGTMSSALKKLSGSKADKSGDLGDLLIRVGLSIAAGDDPRAMKNIAEGTMKGIQSYETSQAVRDKLQPTLIKTLRAFDEAGLTETEREFLLPLVFSSSQTRLTGDERLGNRLESRLAAGDLPGAARTLMSINSDIDYEEALEQVNQMAQQPASTRAAAVTEDDGPGIFDRISSLFGGDDD